MSCFPRNCFCFGPAVARILYMSRTLCSGAVSPLFRKGDSDDPANYRPISLLSALCRVITRALASQLRTRYCFQRNQWGFFTGSTTEVAVAYAMGSMKSGFDVRAGLNLQKAYDSVPRTELRRLVLSRPSVCPVLARQLVSTWAPTCMSTRGQRCPDHVCMMTGVLQRDPIISLLIDLFMGPFLELSYQR